MCEDYKKVKVKINFLPHIEQKDKGNREEREEWRKEGEGW